jgi:hypothetical protein
MPINDGSIVEISTLQERDVSWYEKKAQYGVNPFVYLKYPPLMIGDIVLARTTTGSIYSYEDGLKDTITSVENLIRPGNYRKSIPNPNDRKIRH